MSLVEFLGIEPKDVRDNCILYFAKCLEYHTIFKKKEKKKGSNPTMQSLVILFSVCLWNMLKHQIHYTLVEIMIHTEH